MGTKEHKTTRNTRVEATQTRREMVGYFFFISFSLQINSLFTIFLCRRLLQSGCHDNQYIIKAINKLTWFPWQLAHRHTSINNYTVVMATNGNGSHDNHTKLFNLQKYTSCHGN